MNKLYIDAGGTKIAAYLLNDEKIVKEVLNEPGNINTDYNKAKNNIITILKNLNLDSSYEIIMGVAGATGNPLLASKLKQDLEVIFSTHHFTVLGDLDLVCKLIKDNSFLLVNCGTGTVAINRENNIDSLYLGWGKLVNDIGSGYDIGINFIKFLSYCEDKNNTNSIYLKFLHEHNLNSIREFIEIISKNPKEIGKVSLWLNNQNDKTIALFITSRIQKLFEYLDFIKFENLYLTGSIFEKNISVQKFIKEKFMNKKTNIINIQILLENKFYRN